MSKDNKELIKLIQENPELPLVFDVVTDNIDTDYNCQVFEDCSYRVDTVYFTDDRCYDDFDDILDDFMSDLADEEEYKNLSDEDYEEKIKEYIERNVRHYKAIIITTGY